MFQPNKLKHRKWRKGKSLEREITTKMYDLNFGIAGIKSLEASYLKNNQIEACVKEIKRILGKKGKMWLRIFPHIPRTKKPEGVRMGGGKGDVDHYAAFVRPGTILFEVESKDINLALQALKSASYKLPIKTKIVLKNESI